MTFPVLYSKTSTGKIQTWQIIVINNTYTMTSGQLDGLKSTSKPTIVQGKNLGRANETSSEDQALAEAQSKFDKKKRTGYFENIEDVDKIAYIDPMLAKKFKDRKDKVPYPCILQCKFNGVRCLISNRGAFSREGKEWFTVPHITESLQPFFEKYPDAVLDGELFNLELREQLNEMMSIVKRPKQSSITSEDLAKSRAMIKFYCYDGFGFNDLTVDVDYKSRKYWIDTHIIGSYDFIEKVEDVFVNDEAELIEEYNKFIMDNHEGGMVRFPNMKYKLGGRSSELLKMKPEDSSEGVITAVHLGTGNWGGVAKTVTIEWNGETFDATLKGEREQCLKFLQEKDSWIGKRVTFLYNSLTGKGIPNFPRLDPKNCFKS